ncbi:DUF423 domain-containing protein [Planctomycetaceae bacterium SH139]
MNVRLWILLAGLSGAVGVLVGAFGAHGLEDYLQDRQLDAETVERRIGQFETAVRYHLVHAVALLGLAALAPQLRPRRVQVVGWLFIAGLLLFSGSLYLLVALNQPKLGAITPLGGGSWIVAWSLLAFSAQQSDAAQT